MPVRFAFAYFLGVQVFPCLVLWPLLHFHFSPILSCIHMAATFLHTAHTFRINRQNPGNASKQKTFENYMLNSINWKKSPGIAIPKGYIFEDQHKDYKDWFSKGHFHLIFPVVAENRTFYISKIITEKDKSIPKFLHILRLKLSLDSHKIAINGKPLKWALGNSLKEFSTFPCYFKTWFGCFRNLNSLYWYSG